MVHLPVDLLAVPDAIVSALMTPLSAWIVFNGLDDALVDAAAVIARLRDRSRRRPSMRTLLGAEQSRIAVFVPCWSEAAVLAAMIEANRGRIRYAAYEFFIGAYPNDPATVEVAGELASKYSNVHVALCGHEGPTSKADCLNWIWQRMVAHEKSAGIHFDVIVTHDAEDVIHPDALLWINWYAREFDMVQVPVLPIQRGAWELTYGVYCDEFSEFQARDMPAREWMGSFVPSNGVGTGFRRQALENLGRADSGRVFDPACLTEDYESGLRLRLRGARQVFATCGRSDVATRELFPGALRGAVRQRTRWVTGIALQSWERHGWKGNLATKYWLWRDRKGLVGNPASLLTNLLFLYSAGTWALCRVAEMPREVLPLSGIAVQLVGVASVLAVYRVVYRGVCVGRRFGLRFALLVPVRVVLANLVNSLATICAMHFFAASRLSGKPLRWLKTTHEYPSEDALQSPRQRLGAILVANGFISESQLAEALRSRLPGLRIGERLIELGYLAENDLYEALSLQSGVPVGEIAPEDIRVRVARSLPAHVALGLRLIPVSVESGELTLAGPNLPTAETESAVRAFTRLSPRFRLVTPSNFARLTDAHF